MSTWVMPAPTDDFCGRDLPNHTLFAPAQDGDLVPVRKRPVAEIVRTHNTRDGFTCEACGAVALDLLRQEVHRLTAVSIDLSNQLRVADKTILRLAKEAR